MKLLRVGMPGQEKPALLDHSGTVRDLSNIIHDVGGEFLLQENLLKIARLNPFDLPELEVDRIGPCVKGVGKFICVGLNYKDHAAEAGLEFPKEPIIFLKATSAISGPNDSVVIPRGSKKTDWEVELGVVIGKPGKYIPEVKALSHVAGYCVVNDISEREFQLERGGTWDKGKGCDTFGPIGPWLVTREDIENPQDLRLWLDIDEHRYQNGSTKSMIFNVGHLVSYISNFMSLQTGDIISTGTPSGVGMGQNPPRYLKGGERIYSGIVGLGDQCQTVILE